MTDRTLPAWLRQVLPLICSVRGFDADPRSLPLGLQLDLRHSVTHLQRRSARA